MTGEALRTLITDEAGGPAIEYGLIASLVAVAAVGGLQALGLSVAELYGGVVDVVGVAVTSMGKAL